MSNQNVWSGVSPRKGLMDFHMPEILPEVKLDVKRYISRLNEIGMESIIFVCKDAYGHSYYETRLGRKNVKVEGDMLKDLIYEAHSKGIKIVAYYNVCCDDHVAAENPDYCQRDFEGKPIKRFGTYGYSCVCMNSPYRDLAFKRIREIVENYDVDGVFLDITYVIEGGCYCEYCRSLYRQMYGAEIPVNPPPGTRERKNFLEFRRWTRFRFIRDAVSTIKSVKDIPVGWNHAGDPYMCQVEIDQFADYFSREFHSPNYLLGDLAAKWMRKFGRPFELVIPECYSNWGEWTILPAETLRLLFTITLMNGGNPTIGHVAYPSGKYAGQVADGVLDSIGEAYKWVKRIEDFCVGAESVPYIAVLHTVKNHRLKEYLGLPTMETLEGVHHILVENHIHFDIISEVSEDIISNYEALILPDELYLSEDEVDIISRFVGDGGGLIATYRTSLYDEDGILRGDFALSDVLGASFRNFSNYSVIYIDDVKDEVDVKLPRMPLLLKDRGLIVDVKGDAETLASLMYPAVELKPYRHVYHQHAHPEFETGSAGIIYNSYGRGRCIYMAAPIESSFRRDHYYWLRSIYHLALKKVIQDPLLEVDGPLSLHISLMRKGDRLILHLLNYYAEKTGVVEETIETRNVKVKIGRVKPKRIMAHPQMKEIEWSERNGHIEFKVPPFNHHTMIVIT